MSFVVERRLPDGWRLTHPRYGRIWYEGRNIELFTMLAGEPIGHPWSSPNLAVVPPRGWPPDLSTDARSELRDGWWHVDDVEIEPELGREPDDDDDDGFGRSWLNVADLVAFDWDQVVHWTFCAVLDGPAVEITDDVRAAVSEYVDRNGWVPPVGARAGPLPMDLN